MSILDAVIVKYPPKFVGCNGHSYAQPFGSGGVYDVDAFFEVFCKLINARSWDNRAIPGAIGCWANANGQGAGGWAHQFNTVDQDSQAYNNPPQLGHSAGLATDYGARSSIETLMYGINDLAELGSNNLRPFLEAMRAMAVRAIRSKILPANVGTYQVETGTWGGDGKANSAQSYAGGDRVCTVQGGVKTWTLPSDLPSGRTCSQIFVVRPTDDYVVTVAKNGVTVQAAHIQGSVYCDPSHTGVTNPGTPTVIRVPSCNASDTITVTLTTLTVGGMQCSAFVIETDPSGADGPLLAIPQPATPQSYATYASSPFGPSAGTNPINDAAVQSMKTQLSTGTTLAGANIGPLTEFANYVVTVDPDTVLTKALMPTGDFSYDGLHPVGVGHAKMAKQLAQAVVPRLTARIASAGGTSTPSRFWIPINLRHIANEGWPSGLSFSNSWTSFDANAVVNNFFVYPGMRRDETGRVHLRGRVASGASGTTIVQLPSGYHPENARYYSVIGQDASNNVLTGLATVLPNGSLSITWSTGTPAWWSLDPIHFTAEGT